LTLPPAVPCGGRPRGKQILGMLHLQPLPGTPYHEPGSLARTVQTAVDSARALQDGGADGCLVQTVERVYGVADESDPARVAAAARVVHAVVEATGPGFVVGVQLMRNAIRASLAVARVAGAGFVRAGTLVGATMTEFGLVHADPMGVMEYRNKIDARGVQIIADVDSDAFRWFGEARSAGDVARRALKVGADAVAVGHPDEDEALRKIHSVRREAPGACVFLSGHTTHANASRLLAAADGAFVGSCLEEGGWGGRIDVRRVRDYVRVVRELEA